MQIDSWPEQFQQHFYSEDDAPPLMVYQTAVALVGTREINASLTTYKRGEKPATWSSWLVLDKKLAHLEIEFDAEFWEQTEEQQGYRRVESTVKQCWIRSLTDVVKYRITGLGPVANERAPWWAALHGVELTFSGGEVLPLPGEVGLHGPTSREMSSRFHAAIRMACGL